MLIFWSREKLINWKLNRSFYYYKSTRVFIVETFVKILTNFKNYEMIILIYQFKKWLIEKIKLLEREMENYYLRIKKLSLSFDGKSERDRLVRNNPRDNSLSNLLLENLETILIIFSFLTIAWFRVTINVTKFHSIRGLHTCNRNHYRETIAAN